MTSAPSTRILLVAGLTLGFGACAAAGSGSGVAAGPPPSSGPEGLVARHNAQAEKLEQDGWLRQALDQRLIALTINPGDTSAQKGRERLEDLIERGVATRIREGRAALARGSVVEARRRFLAALALDPANRVAFEALQNEASEVESLKEAPPEVNPLLLEAREALEANDFSTALADLDKLLASSPGHTEGLALKKQLLYRQGRTHLEAKRYAESYWTLRQLAVLAPGYENTASLLEQARRSAIDHHYDRGTQLYGKERLREAIAEWRIVLDLDPQHANARRNIELAEKRLTGGEDRRQR